MDKKPDAALPALGCAVSIFCIILALVFAAAASRPNSWGGYSEAFGSLLFFVFAAIIGIASAYGFSKIPPRKTEKDNNDDYDGF